MKQLQIKTCPMCERDYADYPARSRTMGKEEICPNCGVNQAIQSLKLVSSRIHATQAVNDWSESDSTGKTFKFITTCLERHFHLDWGDLDAHDRKVNDRNLTNSGSLLSSYVIPKELDTELEKKIWISTEADRSITTILFPGEY